jgi:hypothetical protein
VDSHRRNQIPQCLRRHLLNWRAEIDNAIFERQLVINHLITYLCRGPETDRIILTLIFDIVLEVVRIREELDKYLEELDKYLEELEERTN